MRSAEVCQWRGRMELAGTLRKTSALALAGSPCRTAIRHPFGRNGGQGPHLSWESFAVRARASSCADTGAPANAPARSSPDISATFSDGYVMVRQYMNHLLLVTLAAKGQCNPYRDEHPAAGLVEAPPNSAKPRAYAVSHIGDEHLGGDFEYRERSSHDDELDEEASGRIDELRKKRSEEEKRLGIGQRGERSLLEQRPACSGFR